VPGDFGPVVHGIGHGDVDPGGRVVGDLSDTEKVLFGLDLIPKSD